MSILDGCEQQALDSKWDLSRTSACHIGVLNSEMGQLRDEMILMNSRIDKMVVYQEIMMASLAVVAVTFVGLVVQKIWGKK